MAPEATLKPNEPRVIEKRTNKVHKLTVSNRTLDFRLDWSRVCAGLDTDSPD